MNRRHLEERGGDSNLGARQRSFELARALQDVAPRIFDYDRDESDATLALYGFGAGPQVGFAWQCLMARRFAERGVRFIELIDVGASNNWDAHGDMGSHGPLAACHRPTDRGVVA